jgi:hypothetical protein
MAATNKELGDLHGQLAKILTEEIRKENLDKDGNKVRNAAILNVARQFLKDNGIESLGRENENVKELEKVFLPFEQIEDELRTLN